ncbi:MAG: FAD:protein FMN transferase [Deltaproteobacteria bacterium]|nr:FAD:protein FMN transferase [Deltaproteobacteria bacterium]
MRPLLLGLCLLGACTSPAPPVAPADLGLVATSTQVVDPRRPVHRSYDVMGTQMTLTAFTADEAKAVLAFDDAYREMKRLEDLLTVWKPDSDVSRINAAAGNGVGVKVQPETMECLRLAVHFAQLTGGKFDPTFGALSGLWRFDHDQDNVIPDRTQVRKRLKLIDYRQLTLDEATQSAKLERPGMKLHLGGIGKGYAVDKTVALLRARGFQDFMVQAGGDLYVAGTRGPRAWRVGIRDPRGPPSSYFAASEVTDASFSTSGDYERAFLKDGVRYHHILDPATGNPAMACRSVTIMAKDAVTADGISKGVFILGPEKGLALVEAIDGAGAVIVDRNNQVHLSKRLEGRVKLLHPPTPGP